MAHDHLYGSKSTFDIAGIAVTQPDVRDIRDPQVLGTKLLDLREYRFKKRPFHLVHDWLEELSA